MSDRPYNVLFLCNGNAGRSVMAEALMNRLGQGRFQAYSAGCHPKGEVNPYVKPVLESLGYSLADFRSKSWDEFAGSDAPEMDFVFTVCDVAAGEPAPEWPGAPVVAHWGVSDPALVDGSPAQVEFAFTAAARQLRNRIELLTQLPVDKLDHMSLHSHLNEIHVAAGEELA